MPPPVVFFFGPCAFGCGVWSSWFFCRRLWFRVFSGAVLEVARIPEERFEEEVCLSFLFDSTSVLHSVPPSVTGRVMLSPPLYGLPPALQPLIIGILFFPRTSPSEWRLLISSSPPQDRSPSWTGQTAFGCGWSQTWCLHLWSFSLGAGDASRHAP